MEKDGRKKNIIYKIPCKDCKLSYIVKLHNGMTKENLNIEGASETKIKIMEFQTGKIEIHIENLKSTQRFLKSTRET